MRRMTSATTSKKATAATAAIGVVMSTIIVVILLVSGVWNLAHESDLKGTEDRIISAIRENTAESDTRMEEFRGHVVDHVDAHPN